MNPPWCSLGKVCERKKARKVPNPTWEMRSSYPLRENIWEYLHEDKTKRIFNCNPKRKTRRVYCKNTIVKRSKKGKIIGLTLLFLCLGMLIYLWMCNEILKTNLIMNVFSETIISLYINKIINLLIQDVKVTKGNETKEWIGRVALWGIVPLWQVTIPPDTILALRKPIRSDCWPFIGSYGEVIIELPEKINVHYISIEHIRPDTVRSAPRRFILYGILENSTLIKTVDGEYRRKGPAKQYFSLINKNIPLSHLIFRVLTNQGNPKYTCIYRVHIYGSEVNKMF